MQSSPKEKELFLTLLNLSINNEIELRKSVRNTMNFYTATMLSVIGGTFFVSVLLHFS